MKLCGEGTSNGLGIFVRSAKLVRTGDAPVKTPTLISSPTTTSTSNTTTSTPTSTTN